MTRILIESGHERNRNAGDEAYFAAMVPLFRSGGTIAKSLFSLGKIINAIRKMMI